MNRTKILDCTGLACCAPFTFIILILGFAPCLLAEGHLLNPDNCLTGIKAIRILPLGDSITRGSYIDIPKDGEARREALTKPHENMGGYRKPLQDMLMAAGIAYDFVGELDYWAYGHDGKVDPCFDPDHHGLAGFSNREIINGGEVPTPREILQQRGVSEYRVPGIVDVLERHQPDIILLMSGTNGFDAKSRDDLIRIIGEHSDAYLIVASILPISSPKGQGGSVGQYNESLPRTVEAQLRAGKRISLVDMHAVIKPEDLLPDGVHPTKDGMYKMAEIWFESIQSVIKTD